MVRNAGTAFFMLAKSIFFTLPSSARRPRSARERLPPKENKREYGKYEYRKKEERRSDERSHTRLAAYGNARTRLDESRDGGSTEDSARAGSDGVGIHALVESEGFSVFIEKSCTRSATGYRSHRIEHIDHAERNYRHNAEHYGSAAELNIPERSGKRTATSGVHGEEVSEIFPELPGNTAVTGKNVDIRNAHRYSDKRADDDTDNNRGFHFKVRENCDRR